MSDETPGASQGALPPSEVAGASSSRTPVRLTPVQGGQYILTTTQPHNLSATLAQVSFIFVLFCIAINEHIANLIQLNLNLVCI